MEDRQLGKDRQSTGARGHRGTGAQGHGGTGAERHQGAAHYMHRSLWCTLATLGLVACGPASDSAPRNLVRVAVAGNFVGAAREIARLFEASTGIPTEFSVGATGQLYAQAANGAPFDVFLAADEVRPRRLEAAGHAVRGTRFTYAVGRIAVYAPGWDSVGTGAVEFATRLIETVTIANPKTAPYGAVARELLETWGALDRLDGKIVTATSVSQAFQFVASGAAEVGFVSLSQVVDRDESRYWIVPDTLHAPIRQDGVLLVYGEDNPHARAFIDFLTGEEARQVITTFGYIVP